MPENEQTGLGQIKQVQEQTHQMLDAKKQAANRAGDNLWKLYQVNANPYDQDIEAALGDDGYNFFRQYGSGGDRAATAFGIGYLGGRITPSQRQAVEAYIQQRREAETAVNNDRYAAERAAYENNYKYNLGDNTVHISKDVSDNIKGLSASYNRLQAQRDAEKAEYDKIHAAQVQAGRVGENVGNIQEPADTTKEKRQEVVGLLRQQLNDLGINVGTAPEGGEFDTVDALLNSLDYDTENAVRKALELGTSRTEYTPQDTRSFEDKLRERQALQEEVELRNKNRELERARNRQSIAGLAATIGEMVRASEGAQVNPRDWQRIYDNLTAQGKANIDNYQVRMQKMRDDARAERQAAAQAAAAAAEKQREREHDIRMQLAKFNFEGGEKERDRLLKWLLQKDEASSRANVARIRYNGTRTPSQSNIPALGKTYFIPSSQYNSTMLHVAGILQRAGLSFGLKNDIHGVDQRNVLISRTGMALPKIKKNADGTASLEIANRHMGITKDPDKLQKATLTQKDVKELENYLTEIANSTGGTSTWSTEYEREGYNPDEENL